MLIKTTRGGFVDILLGEEMKRNIGIDITPNTKRRCAACRMIIPSVHVKAFDDNHIVYQRFCDWDCVLAYYNEYGVV